MAKSLLPINMVSIGLLLSNGNIDITMEELAEKVTSWQTQSKRIFGVSDDDFINALLMLVLSDLNLNKGIKDFYKLTFREIIPKSLNYNEVYFNDEGEHWLETFEYEDSDLTHLFGLDLKGYKTKMQTEEAMHVFFENGKTSHINSNQVNAFLAGQGITKQLLMHCSE